MFSIKQVATSLQMSTQAIYKQKDDLISKGYMEKNDKGMWEITDNGFNYLQDKKILFMQQHNNQPIQPVANQPIKEDIKEKVLDYLYEIRYLKYLPIDKSKVLKDIISFEDIEKVMINKGLNLNLITPISNNKDTDYLLLKSIFNTKNINLEDLCIKLVVKDGKLESQIYDGDILDSTNYINLQKGSSVQIRKTKKVKIFN